MTADITRLLYSDRTLLSEYDPETGEDREGWADLAHEAIRAMNHLTNSPHAIPAPVAYRVLGNLSGIAHMLPQLCEQLTRGLAKSLSEFDVYDTKRDATESVSDAVSNLEQAAANARTLADRLDAAQVAINSQGYEEVR